jgi:hypothetical protein
VFIRVHPWPILFLRSAISAVYSASTAASKSPVSRSIVVFGRAGFLHLAQHRRKAAMPAASKRQMSHV